MSLSPSALDARPRSWEGDLLLKLAGGTLPGRGRRGGGEGGGGGGGGGRKCGGKGWDPLCTPERRAEQLGPAQLSGWCPGVEPPWSQRPLAHSGSAAGRGGRGPGGLWSRLLLAGSLAPLQEKDKGGPTGLIGKEAWGPDYCQALRALLLPPPGRARPPSAPEPNISTLGSLAGCSPPLAVTSGDLRGGSEPGLLPGAPAVFRAAL